MRMPYMETILGFISFTDIRPIVIEPTLMLGPEEYVKLIYEKKAEARALAALI